MGGGETLPILIFFHDHFTDNIYYYSWWAPWNNVLYTTPLFVAKQFKTTGIPPFFLPEVAGVFDGYRDSYTHIYMFAHVEEHLHVGSAV